MHDDTLLKYSLLTMVIGLFLLFLLVSVVDVQKLSLFEVEDTLEGEVFEVEAEILTVRETDKVIEFTLVAYQPVYEKAIYFKEKKDRFNFSKGDFLRVKGSTYQERIIVDEIIR